MATPSTVDIPIGPVTVRLTASPLVDLVDQVQGMVSPDDRLLSHDVEPATTLWRKAGSGLLEWRSGVRDLVLGEVVDSPGFGLGQVTLVHAVTVDYALARELRSRDATALYETIFLTGEDRGWARVAMPMLVGAISLEDSAVCLLAALKKVAPRFLQLLVVSVRDPEFEVVSKKLPGAAPAAATDVSGPTKVAQSEHHPGASAREWPNRPGDGFGADNLPSLLSSALDVLLALAQVASRAPPSPTSERLLAELSSAFGGPRQRAHRPGPMATLEEAVRLLESAQQPLPDRVQDAVQNAIRVRNELVHLGSAGAADAEPIVTGLQVLSDWVLDRFGEEIAAEWNAAASRDATSRPCSGPPSVRQRGRRADREPGAAQGPKARLPLPVEELSEFLWTSLPGDSLTDLLKRLRARNFQGADRDLVLEHCAEAEDLVDVLTELSKATLRQQLRQRWNVTLHGDAKITELAQKVLERLGFPPRPKAQGANCFKLHVQSARNFLSGSGGQGQLRQAVADCCRELEWLLKLYIRFLAHWAFGSPRPEQLISQHGWLRSAGGPEQEDGGVKVERLSLGALVRVIREMELSARADLSKAELLRDLGERSFLPKSQVNVDGATSDLVDRLVQLRNLFIHDKRTESLDELLPPERVPKAAAEFITYASVLADTFLVTDDQRVFPYVIRIDSINIDQYGRRIVRASSDGEPGKEEETIFTRQELAPGELYLMRPLNNPWRVHPVLVPVGDAARRPSRDHEEEEAGLTP